MAKSEIDVISRRVYERIMKTQREVKTDSKS
jgi:hypothetical protein